MIDLQTKIAPADSKGIAEAARILRQGGLVAFPTETVYGLGADATNGQAVAAIFAAKERPLFNPLIVHVADLEEARRHVELSPRAQALAQKFWPGALTLVLPRRKDSPLSLLVSAGLDSVLQLAELQSEKAEEAYGLYCLLKLLKVQLDDAVEDLHRML